MLRSFAPVLALLSMPGLLLAGFPTLHAARHASTPALVNLQVSHDSCLAHSEPYLAVNPRNPRNLLGASKCFSDPARYRFRIGTFVSYDAGVTWHDNGVLDGPVGYSITSDTTVAFDAAGTGYVAALAANLSGPRVATGVFVWRTSDGGRTFAAPVAVSQQHGFVYDKPWLVVDASGGAYSRALYAAWVHLTDRGRHASILFSRSTDRGRSFTPPRVISAAADSYTQGPVITVGPGGTVHVVYLDTFRNILEAVGSPPGGQHFDAPRLIHRVVQLPDKLPHATFRVTSMPAAAMDPRDGTLYTAWADYRAHRADILLMRSRDGGRTWLGPVLVTGPTVAQADRFMPQLTVTPNAALCVSYFSRELDSAGRLIDVFLASSTDRGAHVGTPMRVTNVSWDPQVDAPIAGRGVTFIGDYQGLAAGAGAVYPFWNDTRTGRQEIFTAAVSVPPTPPIGASATAGPGTTATPLPVPTASTLPTPRPTAMSTGTPLAR